EGFFLNGRMVKFKGVCMHHDLGPLGGAVNDAAIRRQIRILQDMGVNAIRTAHNMPAPELIKAADEMGMMIAVETFDEWGIAKVSNGYNKYFDEWAEKDVVNVVHHFRNNPSVVMWFIGNEVEEQSVMWGSRVARFLQDIVQREDPTRFVSNGMDRPDAVYANGMAAMMEVAGFNYRPFRYKEAYGRLPQQIILGAETASTVSSRGTYKFPLERKSMATYDDHQSSSYDVEHCSWSDLPEDNFVYHDDLPYCIGEFVWTGFDYLGEPTPYYTNWPSHSSLFGIVDLAGIPKDRFYLYRSHWAPEKETLHILPHWTWKGREGETTPVFVYTNHPTVELFINGVSQGKRTKDTSIGIDSTYTDKAQKDFERQKRYRLMWMDTKYEPGTVKAVAYDANGNEMGTEEIHTAGAPHSLVLEADRKTIKADGKDLSFITVSVVDKDGNLCPHADDLVKFKVNGAGSYRAGANGNSASLDLFHEPQMHFFNGKLTAIVESSEKAGTIKFEASAKGVKNASMEIETVL
ncbi:MAG: glycoside hydrolase family 2 protein, partial [Bacteroidales bacterium]|nr:glycoside hydrolase family 2 protein [Bacteroidales bacterium]